MAFLVKICVLTVTIMTCVLSQQEDEIYHPYHQLPLEYWRYSPYEEVKRTPTEFPPKIDIKPLCTCWHESTTNPKPDQKEAIRRSSQGMPYPLPIFKDYKNDVYDDFFQGTQ